MQDLPPRLTSRVQLTTDGHKAYINAVAGAFGPSNIDYAMLVKLFGQTPAGPGRYSPLGCIGIKMRPVMGDAEAEHISTSYVERAKIRIRMQKSRVTRLSNGFSEKVENRQHSVAITSCTTPSAAFHQTLRVTPAMAAGLTDQVWEVVELIALMPKPVARPWGSVKHAKAMAEAPLAKTSADARDDTAARGQ
jgi:hypothetical protein